MPSMSPDTLFIRRAVAADIDDLRHLAALDSARVLLGELMVAESDGVIHAAYSIDEDRAIVDPFLPTADLVTLLRTRVELLRGSRALDGRRHLGPARALPARP